MSIEGKVSWWDIQVTDLAEAQRFYGAVFGWTFQPMGDTYAVAAGPGGEPYGGLTTTGKGDVGGRGTRIYFTADDLEDVLGKVGASGGTVTTDRTEISPEMGWFAEFTDPSGVTIGLWTHNAKAG